MLKRKILLVDDDQDLLLGLGMRLRASGFAVTTAVDGYNALVALRRHQPDLVIVDLGLPAGDGFVVMERLRSMLELADTPVIVLSARDPLGNRERARRLGAHAYFRKPADNVQLLDAIEDALAIAAC